MVKFIGIGCARDALADVLKKQLKEDNCLCAECWHAHTVLAKSILKDKKKYYYKYRKMVERDIRLFQKYWDSLR